MSWIVDDLKFLKDDFVTFLREEFKSMDTNTTTEIVTTTTPKRERFKASDYVIMGAVESEIVPGHMHSVEWGIGCPRCGTANKGELGHGQKTTCFNCGLHMQRWGDVLEVWV